MRQVYEVPAEDMDLIKENNVFISGIKKRIEAGHDKWLTVGEAAKYIKKSPAHLRGRLKDLIGFHKDGTRGSKSPLLFSIDALDTYMSRHYHPPVEQE